MEKLMKKEIDHKYNLFVNNTKGIKPADVLFSLRSVFVEHFGQPSEIPDYTTHSAIYMNSSKAQRWFKINDMLIGYLDFKMQFLALNDPENPIVVRIHEYGIKETTICPLPLFIKQFCNPEGVYLLEKAIFNVR